MSTKIDGVIERLGALSYYQVWQQVVAGFASVIGALHFLMIVFHFVDVRHRCSLPGWDNDTYQIQSNFHNHSVYSWLPLDADGNIDNCNIYDEPVVGGNMSGVGVSECSDYVYDRSDYWGVTVNERFGLVCSQTSVSTLVKVLFTTGLAVGAPLVGVLGDRFGRKLVMVGCLLVGGVSGVVASFSVHIVMYIALRFICGICYVGAALVGHCISMEICGPSKRPVMIAFKSFFWPAGTCTLSLIAYYIQDWNWLLLTASVASAVVGLVMIPLLKETPHYLVTKGRHEEAVELFKTIARWNKKDLPDNLMETLREDEEEAKSEKFGELLKAPTLLKRTLVFLYLWMIAGLGFYGLGFNVGNLTGSIFLNNVVSGAAEFPVFLVCVASSKIGRKSPNIGSLLFGSASLIACALMYVFIDVDAYGYVLVTVAMLGKFAIASAFAFDYFWSSEVFPTTLRSTLVGICSCFARIGSILAPIIVDLHKYTNTPFGKGLGPLVFGSSMLIGGIITFYLPETNKQKIPETIHEANLFMTGNREEDGDDKKFYDNTGYGSESNKIELTKLEFKE